MSCADQDIGGPVVDLKAKRSQDTVPVDFDWHDFLANQPKRSTAYSVGNRVRLRRKHPQNNGVEYECTTAGTTGTVEPRYKSTVGQTFRDGSVTWTVRALSGSSMRTTVTTNSVTPVSGLTLGSFVIVDFIYTILASGGTHGETYAIKHRIECANGEIKEAVGNLPVDDTTED